MFSKKSAMVFMVQTVNITEGELELINQLLVNLETIINEKKLWEIESIIKGEGLEGVIEAFLSMLIANFEDSLVRFRIFPRFMKKMQDGKIRIHSSTMMSPTETMDITWTLITPKGEFQKLVIESINSFTVSMYEEPKQVRSEIPKLDLNWRSFMHTKERIEQTNKIYMKLKEEKGKKEAKAFFDDTENYKEEIDVLFGFLEDQFKIAAYIAIIGANVKGWKGVIMKLDEGYEVIFDDFRDLEVLENLTCPQKMTDEEYLDLLSYQWKQRIRRSKTVIEIEAEKDKKRIIYRIIKKPPPKRSKKLVKGERTVKSKKD